MKNDEKLKTYTIKHKNKPNCRPFLFPIDPKRYKTMHAVIIYNYFMFSVLYYKTEISNAFYVHV